MVFSERCKHDGTAMASSRWLGLMADTLRILQMHMRGVDPRHSMRSLNWVAVKELNLSYHSRDV